MMQTGEGPEQGARADHAIKRLLCLLADPQSPPPPEARFAHVQPEALFEAIGHHGIGSIAMPKLNETLRDDPRYHDLLEKQKEQQIGANALSLFLEAYADEMVVSMRQAGIAAVIVKGPVFSKALYARPSDRQFTDIDILAHPDAREKIAVLLAQMGFRQDVRPFWDKSESNMEQKWVHQENSGILIELHGNLVHYASLRRRISFGFEEYQTASGDHVHPAIAYFMTAVVHAAAGHKFHRLSLLVDVLQALRHLGERDLDRLADVTDALGMRLEVLLCLDLVASLFDEAAAQGALARLEPGRNYAWTRRLINGAAVLDTWRDAGHHSRIRRHALRWMQHIVPRG